MRPQRVWLCDCVWLCVVAWSYDCVALCAWLCGRKREQHRTFSPQAKVRAVVTCKNGIPSYSGVPVMP